MDLAVLANNLKLSFSKNTASVRVAVSNSRIIEQQRSIRIQKENDVHQI